MRHARRGGRGLEFGGSGEDSFVAVVVTKLTGALLFILLLAMVIMALIPRGSGAPDPSELEIPPLEIASGPDLPEAVVGRSYVLTPAHRGGRGTVQWTVEGDLPDGLAWNPVDQRIEGVPRRGLDQPALVRLVVRSEDGAQRDERAVRLSVYEPPPEPAEAPAWAIPAAAAPTLRAWLRHGFGFLLLVLVHMVGMNALNGLGRWSAARAAAKPDPDAPAAARRRLARARALLRIATLLLVAALAWWLWIGPGSNPNPAAPAPPSVAAVD